MIGVRSGLRRLRMVWMTMSVIINVAYKWRLGLLRRLWIRLWIYMGMIWNEIFL